MVTVLRTPARPDPSSSATCALALRMRKSDAAIVAAKKSAVAERNEISLQLVCLALVLSLVMLAGRILSVW